MGEEDGENNTEGEEGVEERVALDRVILWCFCVRMGVCAVETVL